MIVALTALYALALLLVLAVGLALGDLTYRIGLHDQWQMLVIGVFAFASGSVLTPVYLAMLLANRPDRTGQEAGQAQSRTGP